MPSGPITRKRSAASSRHSDGRAAVSGRSIDRVGEGVSAERVGKGRPRRLALDNGVDEQLVGIAERGTAAAGLLEQIGAIEPGRSRTRGLPLDGTEPVALEHCVGTFAEQL